MMTILTKILDTIQPPRGLTKDELRAFKKSFIPTSTKDLARWRFSLAEHGLAGNEIMADLLTELTNNPDLKIRFRHAFTASSGR